MGLANLIGSGIYEKAFKSLKNNDLKALESKEVV